MSVEELPKIISQDAVPEHLRAKRNRVSRWLGFLVLKLMGWNIKGVVPNLKRFIVIGAPHTSNWDFILAMAFILGLNLRLRWMAKHTIFKPGIRWLMMWLGGIPTDRTNPKLIVENVAKIAEKERGVIIGLTPEGTRKKVIKWKTGFLRLAKTLDCPILMIGLDFPKRIIVVGAIFHPTGDNDADLAFIRNYYGQFEGKHSDQF